MIARLFGRLILPHRWTTAWLPSIKDRMAAHILTHELYARTTT